LQTSVKKLTSGDNAKIGGAENGHEFELRTITEKSTENKSY